MMTRQIDISKSTLRELCQSHGVDVLALSRASYVDPLLIWDALIGNATTRETLHMMLYGLNELKGTHYTLADIQANLGHEEV